MRWQYANGDVVNQVNRSLKSRFVNSGFSARPAYQVCSRQIPPAQSSSVVGSSWCYPPARHNRPTGCGVPGDVFCDGTECLRSDLDDKFQEVEFVVGTTSAAGPGQAAAAAEVYSASDISRNDSRVVQAALLGCLLACLARSTEWWQSKL